MKNVLVRMLVLLSLAAPLTAFAANNESRHNDGANSSAGAGQSGCAGAEEGKKQKKEKKSPSAVREEREFERLLMGIYG